MSAIERLQWDSNFFGFSIGKAQLQTASSLKYLTNSAKKQGYQCLYLEMSFKDEIVVDSPSGILKLLEIRTTLVKKNLSKSLTNNNIKDKASKLFLSHFKEISKQISLKSRFYKDLNFRKKAGKLYEQWIENSIFNNYASKFYFVKKKSMPAGFVTIRIKEEKLYIDLFGVHNNFRKRGIGQQLLKVVENWAVSNQFKELRVITQGTNFEVLNFYQKNGFLITDQKLIFHLWIT